MKALPNAMKHQILDYTRVYAAGGGRKGDHFPVTGIQDKYNAHSMPVIQKHRSTNGHSAARQIPGQYAPVLVERLYGEPKEGR